MSLEGLACRVDHAHRLHPLTHVLLVKDDEPGRHGRVGDGVEAHEVVIEAGFLFLEGLLNGQSNIGKIVPVLVGLVVVAVSWLLRLGDARAGRVGVRHRGAGGHLAGRAAVGVAANLGLEPHLDDKKGEHGHHHDEARDGRVNVGEKIGETRVRESIKGGRDELKENSG